MQRVTLFLLLLAPVSVNALEVFACEPEWGSLVKELAGDAANVTLATTAYQDPHNLQARPSLIAAIRRADLLLCSGADLEIGWLPLLLRRSGNPNVQPGKPGYFLAADFVRKLEVPRIVDRSQGDVHPQGNPHVHLNPHNLKRIAHALGERLVAIDPSHKAAYDAALEDFLQRWSSAIEGWEVRGAKLANMRLVSHHLGFSYLADWLKLDMVATLEAKPGVPPSASHLIQLLEQLTPLPPAAIVRTPYENQKPSKWLGQRLQRPFLVLPFAVGGADDVTDLFSLFDVSIRMLEELDQ